jgi:hypothetical protein
MILRRHFAWLPIAVLVVAFSGAAAGASTWRGDRADGRGLTAAVRRAEAGQDTLGPNYFGCYRPVGYEHLVRVWISDNQHERSVDFVAVAYQRAPRNGQGCLVVFEHRRHGIWYVLSFGTSPCDPGSGHAVLAACRALRGHFF